MSTPIDAARDEFRSAYAEYQASLLKARRYETEINRLQSECSRFESEADKAEAAILDARTEHVMGELDDDEMNAIIASASDIRERGRQAKNLLQALDRKSKDHGMAQIGVNRRLDRARSEYCAALAAPIEDMIRADQKLYRQIVEVYARLASINGDGMNTGSQTQYDWLLASLFPEPTGIILAKAMDEFHREHIAPILSNVE
jgi:predicted  nucleic acid-binding Zn-ribbon protein